MIHRIKEGGRLRWGVNIGPGFIGLRLHRRLTVWLDPKARTWVSWLLDLRRDHRMYRPYDADRPDLFCRRCGLSAAEADDFCGGKTYLRYR